MTNEQFDLQMTRVRECFGDHFFNKQRIVACFQSVKDLPYENFIRMVDGFIEHQRQAPTPADFKNAAIKERNKLLNTRVEEQFDCRFCGGSGLITAFRKDAKAAGFSFRCPDQDCKAAKSKCNTFDIRWSSVYENRFEPWFDYEPCRDHTK